MKNAEESSKMRRRGVPMALQAIRPMVAGIDVGSREHWVCGPVRADGEVNVRVFGTTTTQLKELVDWLAQQGTESVARESTSVYWIPLFELLESRGIEAVLVNARQLHHVPGRKTDFHDCQWIQLLHSCGLLRGSFRPGNAIVAMRAIHRQLANLVEERTRCVQWMQKALDQMNVQVHRAVTDLTGTTGMAIVRAIVAGERDPVRLSMLRDHRCQKSVEDIARYLTGTWREEHLFNLTSALHLYAFPSEHHFVSWLRLCPRRPISGGKPLNKKGNALGASRIAGALRMAASSLQRTKTALGAAYRRIARNKGANVAIFAIARRLAQLVYRMMRYGQDYIDVGEQTYDRQFEARRLAGLKEAARSMGYSLTAAPTLAQVPTG